MSFQDAGFDLTVPTRNMKSAVFSIPLGVVVNTMSGSFNIFTIDATSPSFPLVSFRLKPEGTTPAKFAVLLKSDMAKWEKVVKQSEAKVD